MSITTAALFPAPWFQGLNIDSTLLAGGQLYTYAAGTVTPLATYTDSTGNTANANPVVLDAAGQADVWFDSTKLYDLTLKNSVGTTLKTASNVGNPNAGVIWFTDPIAATYVPTISNIINGERVSIFRNIDPSKWSAIRAGTSTYDMGAKHNDLVAAMSAAGYGDLYYPKGRYSTSVTLADCNGLKWTAGTPRGGLVYALAGLAAGSPVIDLTHTETLLDGIAVLADDRATSDGIRIRNRNIILRNGTAGNITNGHAAFRIGVVADGLTGYSPILDNFYSAQNSLANYVISQANAQLNNCTSDGAPWVMITATNYLMYDGQTVNFVVTPTSTVTGGTSGAVGTILSDEDSGASGALFLTVVTGTFQDNEPLVGSAGGNAVCNGTQSSLGDLSRFLQVNGGNYEGWTIGAFDLGGIYGQLSGNIKLQNTVATTTFGVKVRGNNTVMDGPFSIFSGVDTAMVGIDIISTATGCGIIGGTVNIQGKALRAYANNHRLLGLDLSGAQGAELFDGNYVSVVGNCNIHGGAYSLYHRTGHNWKYNGNTYTGSDPQIYFAPVIEPSSLSVISFMRGGDETPETLTVSVNISTGTLAWTGLATQAVCIADSNTAFTVNLVAMPDLGDELIWTVRNTSGGVMGNITFGVMFTLTGGATGLTKPANLNEASVTFACIGTDATCTITNASPGVLTYTAPTTDIYSNGQWITLYSTGTLPAPLIQGRRYAIINLNAGANTFQLSLTSGGAAINTTSAGSGVHTLTRLLMQEQGRTAADVPNNP